MHINLLIKNNLLREGVIMHAIVNNKFDLRLQD